MATNVDLGVEEVDESVPLVNGSSEGVANAMATEGVSRDAASSDRGGCADNRTGGEVEMTQMNSRQDATPPGGVVSGAQSMAVVVLENSYQEPSVVFIIKDVTDSDWSKPRLNCSLALSSAVTDLYDTVAKEAGYMVDSFLLSWGDRDSDGGLESAVPLAPRSTQTLFELGMEGGGDKKYYLYLLDGPDAPPVRNDNTGEAESASGQGAEQGINLASSVNTTTPSSHSLNNVSTAPAGGSTSTSSSWSTSTYNYSNKSDTGYVGLVNQAMTCYLNSLLQTLFMTPEFRNSLYSWKFRGDTGEGIKSIPYQLQRLFIHLQISNKRAVETTDVTKSFGWDSSEAWQQHDVQELCRVMFDALEKRLRKDKHERPELINELYQGNIKDYVKCLQCNSESAREDHFLDVPLVIKPFGATKSYSSVEEAMEGFTQAETLSGDNQYFCEKCQKKCDAHKGLKFRKFPYLLTLQLKRFDFDYSTMHRIKLNDRMCFPNVLNLNKFIDPEDLPKAKDRETLEQEYKNFVVERFGKSRSSYIIHHSGSADGPEDTGEVPADQLVDMLAQGPYVYELFSIMIHSGSAIGGHYYAYIKSFTDRQWYCFNDQSVTRISRDDIEQAFGGTDRSRSYYSTSMYASSANAYMLMYRQVDKSENAVFQMMDALPAHISEQILSEQQQEKMEKERQEWEKNLCKFRVFARHPVSGELLEKKLEVHKDKTLRHTTQEAHRLLGFARVIPLDQCRLVRYDEYSETLDQSFDYTEQDESLVHHVGGPRSFYTFELFLETRKPDETFQVYNKGGLNLKIHVIDLPQGTVRDAVQLRGEHGWTVQHFKEVLGKVFTLDTEFMRVAMETYQSEGKYLNHTDQTLKGEGFYKKHTVFVCCDKEDCDRPYQDSKMEEVLERHANTIRIQVTVPALRPPLPNKVKTRPTAGAFHAPQPPPYPPPSDASRAEADKSVSGFQDNFVDQNNSTDGNARRATSPLESGTAGVHNGEGVADSASGEDRSVEGVASAGESSGTALSATPTAESRDTAAVAVDSHSGSGPLTNSSPVPDAREVPSTAAESSSSANSDTTKQEPRVVTVAIDRRKNLGDLKKMLEAEVGVDSMEFKVYRVYSNNQEYELFRLSDSLQSVPNETRMIVRLGRALMPGEFRIKLFLLQINEVEFFKPLIDSIVAKNMTVLDLKHRIVKETYQQDVDFPYRVDRIRLRKKTWRSPGTVYTDQQVFERDIHVFANYEMFVEPLEGDEPMTEATQMQVYVRHWHPGSCTVDKTREIILDHNTPDHLRTKLSQISGIPKEDILYAKAYGSFPSEVSVLELDNDLDWDMAVSSISGTPSLSLYDDGAVLYFKDAKEKPMEMTAEKRSQIQKQESARLNKYNMTSSSSSQSRYTHHRQEKALKIWTDDDDVSSTPSEGVSEG